MAFVYGVYLFPKSPQFKLINFGDSLIGDLEGVQFRCSIDFGIFLISKAYDCIAGMIFKAL